MSTFRDAELADVAYVEAALGRPTTGRFAVVVRRRDGSPVVIENEPHLRDGTPMPTLYWLVDPAVHDAVSRLEGSGGVHRFEELVDANELHDAHEAYRLRREGSVVQHAAPQPYGGVGGTRQGIKCLHAHLANFLAGGVDPVGALVARQLELPELTIVDVRS